MAPLNMFYENRWRDAWIIFAFFGEHYFVGFTMSERLYCTFSQGFNFISTMGTLIIVRLISLLSLNVTPAASRFLRYTKR
jgi:hypothetical protein